MDAISHQLLLIIAASLTPAAAGNYSPFVVPFIGILFHRRWTIRLIAAVAWFYAYLTVFLITTEGSFWLYVSLFPSMPLTMAFPILTVMLYGICLLRLGPSGRAREFGWIGALAQRASSWLRRATLPYRQWITRRAEMRQEYDEKIRAHMESQQPTAEDLARRHDEFRRQVAAEDHQRQEERRRKEEMESLRMAEKEFSADRPEASRAQQERIRQKRDYARATRPAYSSAKQGAPPPKPARRGATETLLSRKMVVESTSNSGVMRVRFVGWPARLRTLYWSIQIAFVLSVFFFHDSILSYIGSRIGENSIPLLGGIFGSMWKKWF